MNFTQIEKLWTDNGGPAGWAPLMAGIAMAESGGNSTVINDTPRTGDYSVGLWQINYYNGLLASRTNDFGSPAQLQADVNKQARAAISLFGGGPGITNWKNDSTYNAWIAAGAPQKPSAATVSGWLKQTGAGFGNAEPVGPGGKVTPNAVLNFSSCDGKGNIFGILGFNFTYCQLKSITGAGAIVIGGITMGLGVILMAAFGLAGSRTGRQATALVSRPPRASAGFPPAGPRRPRSQPPPRRPPPRNRPSPAAMWPGTTRPSEPVTLPGRVG